ncbi:sensor histidine kinase [Pseudomonas sp. FP198]|uniref:sensor histidine kinase n=1 Tax=Pseudomonas sp. FP198 TaxID=2954084 RepID=UPI0027356EBF|nr:ATP-binding protein [Pseudomonas sp. FP198]WLG93534.1 ATP-binding protein [Pseudomonas sp. FP198]
MGISTHPLVNALGWAVGLVVACGIVIINSETHSDLAPTLLYITLLLMAANLFSINLVITVALMCMFLLTAMFLYNGGYHRWESTTGFFRCLTALSAIAFLALRSKHASDRLRHNQAYLIEAQAQLAHATRLTALGEMAASIAHEVNQPLTAITSSGEACRRWLDRPVPDLKEALDSLDRIVANACRASEVINRTRAMARKCDPLRRPERLDEIVSEALDLVRHQLAQHQVSLKVDLTAASLVDADRVQLQQVIINLVSNACHAMETLPVRDRILYVRSWTHAHDVLLAVTDQGVGITAEILPSLFNPFFTTRKNGLGIGLSICRSIIDFHDGRIWATSETGQGTSFTFSLPLLAKA